MQDSANNGVDSNAGNGQTEQPLQSPPLEAIANQLSSALTLGGPGGTVPARRLRHTSIAVGNGPEAAAQFAQQMGLSKFDSKFDNRQRSESKADKAPQAAQQQQPAKSISYATEAVLGTGAFGTVCSLGCVT